MAASLLRNGGAGFYTAMEALKRPAFLYNTSCVSFGWGGAEDGCLSIKQWRRGFLYSSGGR
eukprot:1157394-Pelagomonas_calceolata.AAC.1